MRLRDIFETVHQFPAQTPHEALIRRVEGGDWDVYDEIKKLDKKSILYIAQKTCYITYTFVDIALEAIKDAIGHNAVSAWNSREIDRLFPATPRAQRRAADGERKVVPFRKDEVSEAVEDIIDPYEGNFALADKAWKYINGAPPKFRGSAYHFNQFHGTETPREGMMMIRKLIDTILIDNDPKAAEALYKEMIHAPNNASSVFYHSLQGMPDTTVSTKLLAGIRGR